jgi:hypothetical protein
MKSAITILVGLFVTITSHADASKTKNRKPSSGEEIGSECEHSALQFAVRKLKLNQPKVTHTDPRSGSDGWTYTVAPLATMEGPAQRPVIISCSPPVDPEVAQCACQQGS